MNKDLTLEDLSAFRADFEKNPINRVAQNAVSRNGVLNAAFNSEAVREITPEFSIDVKDTGSITNQKSSGRCWMFAGLNVLRTIAMKKLKIKDLELSQSYLMFFDKLEKSNYQLEAVLNHLDEEDNSRLMDFIVNIGGQQDGGYWNFFADLVKKYGVCPKSAMPETIPTSASSEMDDVLNTLLAKDTAILRDGHKAGKTIDELRALKANMLSEVYRVLTICIGKPVEEFTFDYTETPDEEKKGKKKVAEKKEEKEESHFKSITSTPKAFFDKYIGTDLDEYVSLVSWPLAKYPFHKTYTAKLTSNIVGSTPAIALNLPIEELKKATIASLKEKEVVWFACDVLSSSYRKEGLLATEAMDLDSLFSLKLGFDKGERLMLHASQCNHAMTFTGVNLDKDGKPNRWKVENSWGDQPGFKGFFVMTDKWFDNYMYEVVVNKKYLSKELVEELKQKPIELEPWAPVNRF